MLKDERLTCLTLTAIEMIIEAKLIVIIVMPDNKPDIKHNVEGLTVTECIDRSKEWLQRELSEDMRAHGAIGYGATCMWREKPSQKQ